MKSYDKRRITFISIFGFLLLASGCSTTRIPAAPSRLSVVAAGAGEKEQARDFARNFVNQKKNETRQAERIKPQAKPAKITDFAWASIQKQKAKSEKAFSLTELIDLALKNNPQTRQSWENTRVARAVERQAESALYPQLNISATATREKQ